MALICEGRGRPRAHLKKLVRAREQIRELRKINYRRSSDFPTLDTPGLSPMSSPVTGAGTAPLLALCLNAVWCLGHNPRCITLIKARGDQMKK